MKTKHMIHFAFVPLTALALITALLILTMREPSPALAANGQEWQQTHGTAPMTHTMSMTGTQGMMGQGMMNQEQAGMGEQMIGMGRRLQMMGMMMQMMGHMHKMHDHMQGMMGSDRPMMGGMREGMMGGNRPITHTMPMTTGMGMMDEMMKMPMMDMNAMHELMGQMMDEMMTEMHEMHHMHQRMGMDPGAMKHDPMHQGPMNHSAAMTETVPTTGTTK